MISCAIYELLPFGFGNVDGFSSPQPLIDKQQKDFHEIDNAFNKHFRCIG